MKQLMCIKWYHKFSSGHGKTEYDIVYKWPDEDMKDYLEDWCENKTKEYWYSEHYRGIDYEIIDSPPAEWMEKYIKKKKDNLESLKTYIDLLLKEFTVRDGSVA